MILHIDTAYYPSLWKLSIPYHYLSGVEEMRVRSFLILFIMSFGQHAYQHRYFKDEGKSRPILPHLSRNSPLPITYERKHQSLQPVYYPNLTPPLIPVPQSRVVYDPSIYGEYNDYVYNSILLDSYKKNADYYRKYRRYGTINDYYDSLPPVRRLRTQLPIIEPSLPVSPVVYINKDNPEMLINLQNYNTILASRVNEVEREKERMHTEVLQEKEQARGYRKKYDRLKNKLRDELADRRVKEMELRQRREMDLAREQEKISQIEQAMLQMSRQLSNNSKILEENIKLKQDLSYEKEKEKIVLFPTVPTVLTRSIMMDRPRLDSQYKQMYRLKRQISDLDKKLGTSSKY